MINKPGNGGIDLPAAAAAACALLLRFSVAVEFSLISL